LNAIDDAVGVRRELARARPEAFLHDFAVALHDQAASLSRQGYHEEALAAVTEAAAAYRTLAAAQPRGFLPDLANTMNNTAAVLADLGRYEDARLTIEDALRTALPMLEQEPSYLPDCGLSLLQTYVGASQGTAGGPDTAIVQRMQAVLRACPD
jgi:tetratricopeptide (TPR) repeat protein